MGVDSIWPVGTGSGKKYPIPDRRVEEDYFTLPHPLMIIGSFVSNVNMQAAIFGPASIPGFLGPFAGIGRYMGQNYPTLCRVLAILTFLVHIFEANVARRRCRELSLSESATIKWTLSTFIFGYPSLIRLNALL